MMNYLSKNELEIVRRGSFKQADIYGTKWREGRDRSLRYLVKHIGCRLAEYTVYRGRLCAQNKERPNSSLPRLWQQSVATPCPWGSP